MKIDIETSPVDDNIKTNNSEEKQKTFFQNIYNLIMIVFFIPPLVGIFGEANNGLLNNSLKFFIENLCISLIFALLWRMSFHDCKRVRFIPYFILLILYFLLSFIIYDLVYANYIKRIIKLCGITCLYESFLAWLACAITLIFGALLFINNKITRSLSALMIIAIHLSVIIDIINYEFTEPAHGTGLMKPIIYLYPENKTEVSVELGNAYKISHSYPKYEKEWNVVADNNSNILYNERNYYGLYWEGKGSVDFDMNDGFVVKGSDSARFLEEKLALLGLSEREANEFIIYWLPKLESNAYNFIKFASIEAQNEYMPLSISPKPNTTIRVLMGYKGLNKKIEVKEQILPPKPERSGFVAVEWGGTEIGDNVVY